MEAVVLLLLLLFLQGVAADPDVVSITSECCPCVQQHLLMPVSAHISVSTPALPCIATNTFINLLSILYFIHTVLYSINRLFALLCLPSQALHQALAVPTSATMQT
jgi:hypothetical protein